MNQIIEQFNKQNAHASQALGVDLGTMEQGGYDWHRSRLGVITASKAVYLCQKSGTSGRETYMNELIHEIATRSPADEINAKALQWGRDNEPHARELLSFMRQPVQQYPIVFKDSTMRCAMSPDGVSDRVEEIKCSWNGAYYIEFLTTGVIPKKNANEWMKQVQFGMWVTGHEVAGFTGFDPRLSKSNIRTIEVARSDKFMKEFDDAVPQFILEMDRKLEQIGYKFGDQWG